MYAYTPPSFIIVAETEHRAKTSMGRHFLLTHAIKWHAQGTEVRRLYTNSLLTKRVSLVQGQNMCVHTYTFESDD